MFYIYGFSDRHSSRPSKLLNGNWIWNTCCHLTNDPVNVGVTKRWLHLSFFIDDYYCACKRCFVIVCVRARVCAWVGVTSTIGMDWGRLSVVQNLRKIMRNVVLWIILLERNLVKCVYDVHHSLWVAWKKILSFWHNTTILTNVFQDRQTDRHKKRRISIQQTRRLTYRETLLLLPPHPSHPHFIPSL